MKRPLFSFSSALLFACAPSPTPTAQVAQVARALPASCRHVWSGPAEAEATTRGAVAEAPAVPYSAETLKGMLARLRAVGAATGGEDFDALNRELDEITSYLRGNAKSTLAPVAAEVEAELGLPQPNAFFLLDAGYFLFAKGDESQKALAARALFELDLRNRVVANSSSEVFYFTHSVAQSAPEGILEHIDRFCLPNQRELALPRHASSLDATLQCVFLYGVVGQASEAHLVEVARKDSSHRLRALEVLNWLGTEASVGAVSALLRAEPSADMFARATGYFMRVGGPSGRDALLSFNLDLLSPDVRKQALGIREQVEGTSEASLAAVVREASPPATIEDDSVVCERLQKMYENYGQDQTTSPSDLLDSGLPPSFLIAQLTAIRQRTLHRVSQHALSDVQLSNWLINVLQYRVGNAPAATP